MKRGYSQNVPLEVGRPLTDHHEEDIPQLPDPRKVTTGPYWRVPVLSRDPWTPSTVRTYKMHVFCSRARRIVFWADEKFSGHRVAERMRRRLNIERWLDEPQTIPLSGGESETQE